MKIIVDCLGGDNSPAANVGGALKALARYGDLQVILVGDEGHVTELIPDDPALKDRIETVHAPGVITGEDKPTDAIRLKKDSSLIASIRLLRERDDASALISTGATGAGGGGDPEDRPHQRGAPSGVLPGTAHHERRHRGDLRQRS